MLSSETPTTDTPTRGRFAHVVYRFRWLYLALWCVLALLWWAAYPEFHLTDWDGGPVRHVVRYVEFYWLGGDRSGDIFLPYGVRFLWAIIPDFVIQRITAISGLHPWGKHNIWRIQFRSATPGKQRGIAG